LSKYLVCHQKKNESTNKKQTNEQTKKEKKKERKKERKTLGDVYNITLHEKVL
jgi:hypothetical protein